MDAVEGDIVGGNSVCEGFRLDPQELVRGFDVD
jgi:hypothetical protein